MLKYLTACFVTGWLGVVGTAHAQGDPREEMRRIQQLGGELSIAQTNLRMQQLDAPLSEEQWKRGVDALATIRQVMQATPRANTADMAVRLSRLDQQAKEIRLVLDVRRDLQAAEDAARTNRLTPEMVNAAKASIDRFESGTPPQLRLAATDYRAKVASWQGATGDKPLQELPAVAHVLSLLIKKPVPREPSIEETVQLYTEAPAGAFIFSLADESSPYHRGAPADDTRRLRFGEALLLLDSQRGPTYANNDLLRVLTVDGRVAEVERGNVATAPPRARPLDLTADDLVVREDSGRPIAVLTKDSEIDYAPEFLKVLAQSDPRRAQFLTAQQKASQCYDAEMKRLDPDNRRGRYDIVKGERVESLSQHYDRRVGDKCQVARFFVLRHQLEKQALAPQRRALFATLALVVKRVNDMFPKALAPRAPLHMAPSSAGENPY